MSQDTDKKSVQEPAKAQVPARVVHSGVKFWRGKWAQKANPMDIETIRISVNGEPLQWQRGVLTIVPDPYLQASRNCVIDKFTQEPGKGRKRSAQIPRFSFDIDTSKPDATYEEFLTMFRAGSQKTREAVATHGLNIPLEQVVPQVG
jgi:hypothetical protein